METNHKELMYAIDKFKEKYGVKPYTMKELEKIIIAKRIKDNDKVLKGRK